MNRIAIAMILLLLPTGATEAQTRSMTGTVVDSQSGTYKWSAIVIQVGGKKYYVYTLSGVGRSPSTVGTVDEVGRTVRVYYTKVVSSPGYDGELKATKIVEVTSTTGRGSNVPADPCTYCGVWEYLDRESQNAYFLNITRAGAGTFRLDPGGYAYNGQIVWPDVILRTGDVIHLKPSKGALVATFDSMNFQATGGKYFKYRVTVELTAASKLTYTVQMFDAGKRVDSARHEATRRFR